MATNNPDGFGIPRPQIKYSLYDSQNYVSKSFGTILKLHKFVFDRLGIPEKDQFLQTEPGTYGLAAASARDFEQQADCRERSSRGLRATDGRAPPPLWGPESSPAGQVLEILGGLGVALNTQGRFSEAEPILRRALEIMEKSLGTDHPMIAENNEDESYEANGIVESEL